MLLRLMAAACLAQGIRVSFVVGLRGSTSTIILVLLRLPRHRQQAEEPLPLLLEPLPPSPVVYRKHGIILVVIREIDSSLKDLGRLTLPHPEIMLTGEC